MAAGVIAYKFLDEGAVGPFTGFRWPAGEWVDAGGVDPCLEGIHACRVRDLPVWLGRELWEIELAGDVLERERKVVAPRGRLTRRIEAWNEAAAHDFGRFCVKRTRERVGFLPVLGGYVADVERFVACGGSRSPASLRHAPPSSAMGLSRTRRSGSYRRPG